MEMEGVVNGLRVCVCGRKDVRGEGGEKSEKRVDQEEKMWRNEEGIDYSIE